MNRNTRNTSRLKISSRLYLAICQMGKGSDHLVEQLLKEGADVNEPAIVDSMRIGGKPYGVTPVYAAVMEGQLQLLPRLLGSGRTEIPKAMTKLRDPDGRRMPDVHILERLHIAKPGTPFRTALRQIVDSIVPGCPDVPPALWRLAEELISPTVKGTPRDSDFSHTRDIYECLMLGATPPADSKKSPGDQWAQLFARRYVDPAGVDDEWDRYAISVLIKRMPDAPDLIRRALNTGLSPNQDIGDYRLLHMAARYDNVSVLEAMIEAGADLRHPLKVPIRKGDARLRTPMEIAKAYGSSNAEQLLSVAFARERIESVVRQRAPAPA